MNEWMEWSETDLFLLKSKNLGLATDSSSSRGPPPPSFLPSLPLFCHDVRCHCRNTFQVNRWMEGCTNNECAAVALGIPSINHDDDPAFPCTQQISRGGGGKSFLIESPKTKGQHFNE